MYKWAAHKHWLDAIICLFRSTALCDGICSRRVIPFCIENFIYVSFRRSHVYFCICNINWIFRSVGTKVMYFIAVVWLLHMDVGWMWKAVRIMTCFRQKHIEYALTSIYLYCWAQDCMNEHFILDRERHSEAFLLMCVKVWEEDEKKIHNWNADSTGLQGWCRRGFLF